MGYNSFPTSIFEKLDDSNYLHWCQYVGPVIKSHKLKCLVNPVVPPRYLNELDLANDIVNPDYVWEKINEYFSLQTESRARQLCTVMRAVKLDNKSIEVHLLEIKLC